MRGICTICGIENELQKHHIDYKKNMIIKICSRCHGKLTSIDNKIKSIENNLNNNKKINIRCNKCKYSWYYGGKNPYYATCPCCLQKVKVILHLTVTQMAKNFTGV